MTYCFNVEKYFKQKYLNNYMKSHDFIYLIFLFQF